MATRIKTISKALLLLCFALTFTCSCDKVYTRYSRSYILGYECASGITTTTGEEANLPTIGISPSFTDGMLVTFRDEGEKKEKFDDISNLHNDVSYNRNVYLILDMITTQKCLYPDVISYIVSADKDFDSSHPAGTSLNDLLTISYSSYERFIQSGYDESISAPADYTKPLSEVRSLSLLERNYGILHFTKAPDKSGTYTINITIHCNEGSVFKTSVEVEF